MTKYFMMKMSTESDKSSAAEPFARTSTVTSTSHLPQTIKTRMDDLQQLLVTNFAFIESKFAFIELLIFTVLKEHKDGDTSSEGQALEAGGVKEARCNVTTPNQDTRRLATLQPLQTVEVCSDVADVFINLSRPDERTLSTTRSDSAHRVNASSLQATHHEGSSDTRHPANDSRLTKIQETLDKILDSF